jgi:hypothetical protein
LAARLWPWGILTAIASVIERAGFSRRACPFAPEHQRIVVPCRGVLADAGVPIPPRGMTDRSRAERDDAGATALQRPSRVASQNATCLVGGARSGRGSKQKLRGWVWHAACDQRRVLLLIPT